MRKRLPAFIIITALLLLAALITASTALVILLLVVVLYGLLSLISLCFFRSRVHLRLLTPATQHIDEPVTVTLSDTGNLSRGDIAGQLEIVSY